MLQSRGVHLPDYVELTAVANLSPLIGPRLVP